MKILQILLLSGCFIAQVNLCNNIQAQVKSDKHVIGARKCGFFSEFLGVLAHIAWCEEAGKKPVVFWDKKFVYYEPDGWNNIQNAWEYYFEPICNAKYEPTDIVDYKFQAPNGFFFPWSDFRNIEIMRPLAHSIIKKYIKIKPYVLDIVDDFHKKTMKNCITIGIHLRGTNKGTEAKTEINPANLIKKAQEYAYLAASTGKNVKYLVASDEQKLIDFAKKELTRQSDDTVHGEVISYTAERSKGTETNYYTFLGTKKENGFFAKRGLDVLVEVLLLSQCSYFVHTRSNVSTAVIFFNPNLIHYQFDGFAKMQEQVKTKPTTTKPAATKPTTKPANLKIKNKK